MREQSSLFKTIDWQLILIYFLMVGFGWLNIYAAVYDVEAQQSIFDSSLNSGKQLIWVFSSFILITIIFIIDFKFYHAFALPIYGAMILSLIAVLFFGIEVAGSKSWFGIGFIRIQPAEFAKTATALAIAHFLGNPQTKAGKPFSFSILFLLMLIPMGLIILQGDTGSALVFSAFIFALHREGIPNIFLFGGLILAFTSIFILYYREWLANNSIVVISVLSIIAFAGLVLLLIKKINLLSFSIIIGILLSFYIFSNIIFFAYSDVLKPHHKKRIESLFNPDKYSDDVGYQVIQSKIAIGSGGITGKGFLEGTQTKFKFIPKQSTDFIFCTVGEEHGWIGSFILTGIFLWLLFRIIHVAERQKSRFSRVYGYCVASIIFFHFFINIGMTIGLFPVIGIPLPFFSYGGSSLWSFTILLFMFIKLDAHRMQVLGRAV